MSRFNSVARNAEAHISQARGSIAAEKPAGTQRTNNYSNGSGHSRNGNVYGTHGNSYGNNRSTPIVEAAPRPRNRLLASLPSPLWERFAPHIRHALLIPGQVLIESRRPVERVYFPNSGLISLAMMTRDGAQVEVGMVGREGLTCTLETMIAPAPLGRALVQIAGNACWLPLDLVRSEFNNDAAMRNWLLNYWEVLTAQAAQAALCNRLHTVEERLSRWLLLVRDRIGNSEIEITHEFIAHTLGARRSGVTVALGALQQAGLIDGTRGKITILEADQLAACSCECHAVLSERFSHFEGAQQQAMEGGAVNSTAKFPLMNSALSPNLALRVTP